MPLGYLDNLIWKDSYPISATINSFIKYLSEFTLLFAQGLRSIGMFNYEKRVNGSKSFIVNSVLHTEGLGLYKFFNEECLGKIEIDFDGKINSFSFNKKNLKVDAFIKIIEE